MSARPVKLFIVAGEPSGDQLGGKLMAALKARTNGTIDIKGVGGETMIAEGLEPPFPLAEIAVMGPTAILKRLPLLRRRVLETVEAANEADPDVIVIIDSPEFTHRVASRVRKKRPDIPIVNYVSPTVWAWRPGRARKMKPYVDHILALLPFEPDAHAKLGGPKCSYVGHPLVEKISWIDQLNTSALQEKLKLDKTVPALVILPGSRPNEVIHLMKPFGEALDTLEKKIGKFETLIPAVPSVRAMIDEQLKGWTRKVHIIEGSDDKFTAFRLARAALAASGTVTLELGVAGAPMVVAYRVEAITAWILRRLIKAPSVVLANLVLGRNAFPELLQEDCTPSNIADEMNNIVLEGPKREEQLAALLQIRDKMVLENQTPSEKAAEIILNYAAKGLDAYS